MSAPRLGRAPAVLLVPAILAVALLVVPLVALVLDTPWGTLPEHLGSEAVRQALVITALSSLLTVIACVVLGTPLAWLLARVDFRGRLVVRSLVLVPLVLPPVVAGVALRHRVRAQRADRPAPAVYGSIPYTTSGVVLAHTFVSLPFYVLAVEGALRTHGASYDVVAATLGADRWTTFRRVTLPLALPGVLAGSGPGVGAQRSGSSARPSRSPATTPGTTQTMPSLIYVALKSDPDRRPDPQPDPAGPLGRRAGAAARATGRSADERGSGEVDSPGTGARRADGRGRARSWSSSDPTAPASRPLLRAIAGLVAGPRSCVGDGATWTDLEVRRGDASGYVFQDQRLFPHLSALDNVAFGPRARGRSRADAERDARDVARALRHRRARRPQAARALRRSGPARGHRPGPGNRARRPAARRTLLRARRVGADGPAHRARPAPARLRRHRAAGHPRRHRRAHPRRPGARARRGPGRPGRAARPRSPRGPAPPTSRASSASTSSRDGDEQVAFTPDAVVVSLARARGLVPPSLARHGGERARRTATPYACWCTPAPTCSPTSLLRPRPSSGWHPAGGLAVGQGDRREPVRRSRRRPITCAP